MLNFIKNLLSGSSSDEEPANHDKKLHVATCALFIELAKADSNFTDEEQDHIITFMQNFFNLEEEYVNELIELAHEDIKESISLYEFTTILDKSFSREEKFELLKNLWRVIYTDKHLDKYEDQLVKRIGGMLNMDYQDIIGAKLIVKEEMGI